MAITAKFANPVEWSNTNTYSKQEIVIYNGDSYTAIQDVPTGIDLSNTEYWYPTGNLYGRLASVEDTANTASSNAQTAVDTANTANGVASSASSRVVDLASDINTYAKNDFHYFTSGRCVIFSDDRISSSNLQTYFASALGMSTSKVEGYSYSSATFDSSSNNSFYRYFNNSYLEDGDSAETDVTLVLVIGGYNDTGTSSNIVTGFANLDSALHSHFTNAHIAYLYSGFTYGNFDTISNRIVRYRNWSYLCSMSSVWCDIKLDAYLGLVNMNENSVTIGTTLSATQVQRFANFCAKLLAGGSIPMSDIANTSSFYGGCLELRVAGDTTIISLVAPHWTSALGTSITYSSSHAETGGNQGATVIDSTASHLLYFDDDFRSHIPFNLPAIIHSGSNYYGGTVGIDIRSTGQLWLYDCAFGSGSGYPSAVMGNSWLLPGQVTFPTWWL